MRTVGTIGYDDIQSAMTSIAQLAQSVSEHGWPAGVERFAWELDAADGACLHQELGLRHTAWKVLLGATGRTSALVVERGLGSTALSLAADFERVYVDADPDLQAVIAARAERTGVRNLEFVDWRSLDLRSLDAAVLYGLTARQTTQELIDGLSARLLPAGSLYVAMPRTRRGNEIAGVRRRLRRRFPSVRAYSYRTNRGFGDVYELSSLDVGSRGGWRRAAAAWAAPFLAPGFGILASNTDTASVYDGVVAAVEQKLGRAVMPNRLLLSNPFGVTLVTDRWIVRLPLSAEALERNRTNHEALEALRHRLPATETPAPMLVGTAGSQPFFVESLLRGTDATPVLLPEAAAWITRLHLATLRPEVLNRQQIDRLVASPFKRLRSVRMSDCQRETVDRLERYVTETLRGQRVGLVFAHGDYALDNILARPDGHTVAGVFDWDISEQQGLPLLDLLYLFGSAERYRTGETMGQVFRRCIVPMDFRTPDRDLLRRYIQALDIPEHLLRALRAMSWVHHVGVRTYNPEAYRPRPQGTDATADAIDAIRSLVEHEPERRTA